MNFTMDQKVLFKHCDPAGIVFYPRYFEMVNDCVEAFFDHVGFPFETLLKSGGVPTAQIETSFHAPNRHGDLLKLSLDLTRIGGASLGVAIRGTADGTNNFSTAITLVQTNASGRPTPWTDPMRHAFQPYLRSP